VRGLWVDEEDGEDEVEEERVNAKELWKDETERERVDKKDELLDKQAEAFWTR
jgi:hypothetical protein